MFLRKYYNEYINFYEKIIRLFERSLSENYPRFINKNVDIEEAYEIYFYLREMRRKLCDRKSAIVLYSSIIKSIDSVRKYINELEKICS